MHQVKLLLDRYEYVSTVSKNSMKSVQLFVNRNTGQHAIGKVQEASLMKDSKFRNVLHEASFTQVMQGYRGVPFMIWSGKTKQQKIVLLVQELGHTLSEYLAMCKGKFSLKTVCMLGVQMIEIVKTFHDKGFIVSNVSVDLFQFGKGSKSLDLFANNLSQCMVYKDFKTMNHVLQPRQYFRMPANIFESYAVYKSQQKSRKDDIESVLLIMIFMLKGELPWSKDFRRQQQFRPPDQKFIQTFLNTKLICEGTPFCDLLEDCRLLQFQQQPAYHWYILKLKSILYKYDQEFDYLYDWMTCSTYIESLSVTRYVPEIMTEKDKQFLQQLQEQIFPHIDIDEIWTKNQPDQQRQPSQQSRFDPFRNKQDISDQVNKQRMRQEKKIQKLNQHQQADEKKQKQEKQQIIDTKITQKKKYKKQCQIM